MDDDINEDFDDQEDMEDRLEEFGLGNFKHYLGPLGAVSLGFNQVTWKPTVQDLQEWIRHAVKKIEPKTSFAAIKRQITLTVINLPSTGITFLRNAKVLVVSSTKTRSREKAENPTAVVIDSSEKKHLLVTNNAGFALIGPYLQPGTQVRQVDETKVGKAVAKVLKDPTSRKYWESRFIRALLGMSIGKEVIVLAGPKNAGKGLIKEIMVTAFGTYGLCVDKKYLTASRTQDLRRRIFRAGTVRAVFISEFHYKDTIDVGTIKELTDGRNIDHGYARVRHSSMTVNLRIFVDTNLPIPRMPGDSLSDRVFYIPVGNPIPQSERVAYDQLGVCEGEDFDEYMTALFQEWVPVFNNTPPAPSKLMAMASLWEEIINAPLEAFCRDCLIIGQTSSNSRIDPTLTVERLYRILDRYVRAKHRHLCQQLGFDFHADGTRMTRQEVDSILPGVSFKDFKDFMNRRTGEVANRNTRTGSGYVWRNVIAKEALVHHFGDYAAIEEIHELHRIFEDIDNDVLYHERNAAEFRQGRRIQQARLLQEPLEQAKTFMEQHKLHTGIEPQAISEEIVNFINTPADPPAVDNSTPRSSMRDHQMPKVNYGWPVPFNALFFNQPGAESNGNFDDIEYDPPTNMNGGGKR